MAINQGCYPISLFKSAGDFAKTLWTFILFPPLTLLVSTFQFEKLVILTCWVCYSTTGWNEKSPERAQLNLCDKYIYSLYLDQNVNHCFNHLSVQNESLTYLISWFTRFKWCHYLNSMHRHQWVWSKQFYTRNRTRDLHQNRWVPACFQTGYCPL